MMAKSEQQNPTTNNQLPITKNHLQILPLSFLYNQYNTKSFLRGYSYILAVKQELDDKRTTLPYISTKSMWLFEYLLSNIQLSRLYRASTLCEIFSREHILRHDDVSGLNQLIQKEFQWNLGNEARSNPWTTDYSNIYAIEDGRRQWNADHRRKLPKLAWG